MLLSDMSIAMQELNAEFFGILRSGDYSYHFYKIDNLFVYLEENRYELDGSVNMIKFAGFFKSSRSLRQYCDETYLNSGLLPPTNNGLWHCKMSLQPMYGIVEFLQTAQGLLNFKPLSPYTVKQSLQYWNEGKKEYMPLIEAISNITKCNEHTN